MTLIVNNGMHAVPGSGYQKQQCKLIACVVSLNCPLPAIGFALYGLVPQFQGSLLLSSRSTIMRTSREGNDAGSKPKTELCQNSLFREAEGQIIEIRKKKN